MKYLLIWSVLWTLSLHAFAQDSLGLNLEALQALETEELYSEAEEHIISLQDAPISRLQYAEIGLKRAEEEEDLDQIANFTNRLAVIYAELGLFQKALEQAQKSYEFGVQTAGLKDDIWALFRLSDIHMKLKNDSLALEEAREAVQKSRKANLQPELAWSFNALGELYRNHERYDSATVYYNKAMALFEASDDQRGVLFMRHNLGIVYVKIGELNKAEHEFELAEAIDTGDLLSELEVGRAITQIIATKYSVDSAIHYGNQMLDLAVEKQYPIWGKHYYADLSELYRKKGDSGKAWAYHLKADSLKDLQAGEQVRLQASVVDHEYRMQLLEIEKELQTEESWKQLIVWISILIVVGLLGALTVIQVTNSKRTRRINQQLSEQNEHLDELIKEKDVWMNLMAHDLKAPLTSIGGLLDMLEDESLPAPIRQQVLRNIKKSVFKGSELITQLLEISRLESGEVRVVIEETDLRELVEDTAQTFQANAAQKGITLQTDLPNKPVVCATDPLLAQRILENFVSNALKFSPSGTQVRLALENGGQQYRILVEDQGPGMSAEDQQNLFQKFKKLSAQPTAGESSTGLGLSIVKLLSERIHADIEVQSQLGTGTTFSLALPKQSAS